MRLRWIFSALLIAGLFAACGGGGTPTAENGVSVGETGGITPGGGEDNETLPIASVLDRDVNITVKNPTSGSNAGSLTILRGNSLVTNNNTPVTRPWKLCYKYYCGLHLPQCDLDMPIPDTGDPATEAILASAMDIQIKYLDNNQSCGCNFQGGDIPDTQVGVQVRFKIPGCIIVPNGPEKGKKYVVRRCDKLKIYVTDQVCGTQGEWIDAVVGNHCCVTFRLHHLPAHLVIYIVVRPEDLTGVSGGSN